MGTVAEGMIEKLTARFSPTKIELRDDSSRHAGHGGAHPDGESHFSLTIESDAFTGLNRVQRQRLVYGALAEELKARVHALSVTALAPGEAA
ncbi:MAG: BolA family protein [Caulobacteraceae bacterium]